jgi:hypothetical protein
MAVSLSALRTSRTLLPRNIFFLLLVLFFVCCVNPRPAGFVKFKKKKKKKKKKKINDLIKTRTFDLNTNNSSSKDSLYASNMKRANHIPHMIDLCLKAICQPCGDVLMPNSAHSFLNGKQTR